MTDTPKKLIVDIATGKQTYVDLTAEAMAQEAEARKHEEEAKAAADAEAKAALLAKLDITEATGYAYDIAIAGLPFFISPLDDSPYRRVTAQYRKQQIDQSVNLVSRR
jgi:hypothetical protein